VKSENGDVHSEIIEPKLESRIRKDWLFSSSKVSAYVSNGYLGSGDFSKNRQKSSKKSKSTCSTKSVAAANYSNLYVNRKPACGIPPSGVASPSVSSSSTASRIPPDNDTVSMKAVNPSIEVRSFVDKSALTPSGSMATTRSNLVSDQQLRAESTNSGYIAPYGTAAEIASFVGTHGCEPSSFVFPSNRRVFVKGDGKGKNKGKKGKTLLAK